MVTKKIALGVALVVSFALAGVAVASSAGPDGAALTGRVLNTGGVAVRNVAVRVLEYDQDTGTGSFDLVEVSSGLTGHDGSFRIEGIEEGTYKVLFDSSPKYARQYYLAAGSGLEARDVVSTGGGVVALHDVVLQRGAVLSGVVTRSDGTAVAGADIALF
ncbi:MAG: carboxypeptidase regulatory-like domain-containing protein, partial [Bifidobacteriaceae bacterium]|nr:carboxypeptidase regulatory-like domain-containing protein [Bifidobacteriaceae bacterium]